MWQKIKVFMNHERYQVIAFAFTTAVVVWIYGCQSETRSLHRPNVKVTRGELQIELDTLLATAEERFADLDQQDALKQTLFENALIWSQTGAFNPVGLFVSLAAIAGVGATVDNVRKRKVIKTINGTAA